MDPIEVTSDEVRRAILDQAHTLVVKVGTNVVTNAQGHLDLDRVRRLAEQIHRIRTQGKQVALVSSGAIGAGVGRLGLGTRPKDLRGLQACAAVGQSALMAAYEEEFGRFGYHAAQILLTAADFDNRTRYLNIRNTVTALFEWNCIPIINENDTVSVAEIRYGDNDHLAAMVALLLRTPLLILLTVVDGLYTADPRIDPEARLLPVVEKIDSSVTGLAGSSRSALGTGGMRSKLKAAQLATAAGESVIIANGSTLGILDEIMSAKPVGTLFLSRGCSLPSWKRWIGLTAQPRGRYIVDTGARRAIQEHGRSLLAIGIVNVVGTFNKGDVIAIVDLEGNEFARGLTNYSAADALRIRGQRTEPIGELLGGNTYDAVVHRDNLVITV